MRKPDLFFVSHDRAFIVGDRVGGAPDLVIEVLSPEPRIGRTDERLKWFAEYGVLECWLVHEDRRAVEIVRFEDRRIVARTVYTRRVPIVSTVLPEFVACLDDILR